MTSPGESQRFAAPSPKKRICLEVDKYVQRAEDILRTLREGEDQDYYSNVVKNINEYLEDKEKGTTPGKCIINDAIHGPIELSPLLFQIINTPEFHRLKDVHQLGAAHYVYPGANHTRFDHSLGVCYLAGEFAKSLRDQIKKLNKDKFPEEKYFFEDEEVLCVEIAGLCHDLGHGPFSHMFEHKYVFTEECDIKKKIVHEQLSVDIFKRLLVENPKVLAEFVHANLEKKHIRLIGEMIQPPKELKKRADSNRVFLYEIVANKRTGIDVDKWDYYARDCHYLGVQQDFQWRRCMLLGRIVETPDGYKDEKRLRIAFRDKELDNIYGMFRTRAVLHQKAYQHKTIKAVEMMIADAIVKVHEMPLIHLPTSKETKSIKEAAELACTGEDLKWYLALSDSVIGTIKSATSDPSNKDQSDKLKEAQDLLRRVEQRSLYSCFATFRIPKLAVGCTVCRDKDKKECVDDKCLKVKIVMDLYSDPQLKKKFSEDIYKHFKRDHRESLFHEDDLRMEIVKIKLPSEGDEDPLKQVVFYKKDTVQRDEFPIPYPFEEVLKEKASKLVVPQAFVEYELRVYNTSRTADKQNDKDGLKKATEKTLTDRLKAKKQQESAKPQQAASKT